MSRPRPLEVAVQLIRDAIVGQQSGEFGGGEWFHDRARRVMAGMTSRGDRERLLASMAMLAASMAQRVPDDLREQVFDELVAAVRLSPADQAMLLELARYGMVG